MVSKLYPFSMTFILYCSTRLCISQRLWWSAVGDSDLSPILMRHSHFLFRLSILLRATRHGHFTSRKDLQHRGRNPSIQLEHASASVDPGGSSHSVAAHPPGARMWVRVARPGTFCRKEIIPMCQKTWKEIGHPVSP